MTPEAGGEHAPRPEIGRADGPRIYVASLSDYNAGRLHGRWIEATAGHDTVAREVQEMLAESTEGIAEEHAIHDYEGWGPLQLSEYESLETVCNLAEGIDIYGPAFAHLAAALDRSEWNELDRFDELYRGQWNSIGEYAEELLQDIGVDLDEIGPEILQPYISVDLEAFGRDLAYDLVICEDGTGGVHVFDRD